MVLLLFGAAAVYFLFLTPKASAASSAHEVPVDYNPADPIGSWQKALEKDIAEHPSGATPSEAGMDAAWIELHKKKGHVYPEELPSAGGAGDTGYALAGDIPNMPRTSQFLVISSLFEDRNPGTLLLKSDVVEALGYPMAALRLRKKAIRLAAENPVV